MQKFLSLLYPKALFRHSFAPILTRTFSTFPSKSVEPSNSNDSAEEFTSDSDSEFEQLPDYPNSDTKGEFVTSDFMQNFRDKPFVDKIRLKIYGGHGGDGSFTFYRDRLVRTGAPDGGDGGDGGSFYFKAVEKFNDLKYFKRPELHGNRGRSGARLKKNGKVGADLYYPVPIGTLVWEMKLVEKRLDRATRSKLTRKEYSTRYTAVKRKLLADLNVEGSSVLVAKGGKGGRGNAIHRGLQAPEKGKPGEEINIMLELKSLADIGLVGYPNAGKSTVLATLTRAFPKIAAYPFTTMQPTVGKIEFIDEFIMTMADIPGLIEGSHENKGLGHEFLRHIERTKLLMFVLDISQDDLLREYKTLKRELELYGKDVFKGKPEVIVLNKVDLIDNSEDKIKELKEKTGVEVIGISAKYSTGLDKIVVKLREMVEEVRKKEEEEIKAQIGVDV